MLQVSRARAKILIDTYRHTHTRTHRKHENIYSRAHTTALVIFLRRQTLGEVLYIGHRPRHITIITKPEPLGRSSVYFESLRRSCVISRRRNSARNKNARLRQHREDFNHLARHVFLLRNSLNRTNHQTRAEKISRYR